MTTEEESTTSGSIDTCIPKHFEFHHTDAATVSLPHSYQLIPPSVTSLSQCASWQIEQLEQEIIQEQQHQEPANAELITDLEDALDDGFVLCDLRVIQQKLLAWRHLFPRIKPFFALKCNPDPMVAAVLGHSNQAAGFDCASLSEITLALESSNHNANLVVYANPQRAERDLEASLEHGISAFTLDGEEELYKIHRAYQKHQEQKQQQNNTTATKCPQIILRLLVPDEGSTVPLGEKFGAPPDRVSSLVHLAIQLQLPIIGVSFHCGSGCHDPSAYANAIRIAHDAMITIDQLQLESNDKNDVIPTDTTATTKLEKCWLLDIGGGFPGHDGAFGDTGRFTGNITAPIASDNENGSKPDNNNNDESVETAQKIATAINPLLDELFPADESHVQIISEPGRYFVEGAFSLCSRIYRVQRRENTNGIGSTMHYTIAQGVQGVFKDVLLCGESFEPTPLQLQVPLKMQVDNEEKDSSAQMLYPSTIHGPSGDNLDVVCPFIELPILQVGDWLLFDRMGAYTLSISARSGRPPIRYVTGK